MADDDDQEEGAEGAEGAEGGSGGKKKIILFAVLGLVLVGLSVGGTLMALNAFKPEPVEEAALAEGEELPPAKLSAIYFPLKPAIIVNFDARGKQRFLQAEVTLMAREPDVVAALELHMPMVRNSLVMLFSGQVYSELQTAEGKELLRQQALDEVQLLLMQEIEKTGVEQVLFTNFVMQ